MPPTSFDFSAYDRTVIGFHGTDEDAAERLVNGDPFKASDRDMEWFGDGIYFWEHAPKQAWSWSRKIRKAEKPAVVGALIRLGNCLDLLDSANILVLKQFKAEMEEKFKAAGISLPENHRRQMKLDCAVFNLLYKTSDDQGSSIQTARAVYVPADTRKRIWKGSWISEETHLQICVRNPDNILAVWHVRPDGRYGRPRKKAASEE